MSKSIRISDYLAAEVERLAASEKRSLANMVQVLLEQALQLPEHFNQPKIGPATKEPRVAVEAPTDGTLSPPISADAQPRDIPSRTVAPADPHFKPDFKK